MGDTHQLSVGYVRAKLRKYRDRWAQFTLSPTSYWYQHLVEAGFDPEKQIEVKGLYEHVWKRPANWPSWGAKGQPEFHLVFRSVRFTQDGEEAKPFGMIHPKYAKRMSLSFKLSDIAKSPLKEYLEKQARDCQRLLPSVTGPGERGD